MPANWGGAGAGALSGAATGSIFGPVGSAIGGGIGGIMGLLSGSGKPKVKQVSTLTPEQQQALASVLQQIGQMGGQGGGYNQAQQYYQGLLQGPGGSDAYQNFAAPYMQNFEQQIVPALAERFAGLTGPLGNPGQSSGFGQAVGGAGAQLQAQLANLFANLQQNAAGSLTGQYNNLLNQGLGTRAFESLYQPNTGLAGALPGIVGGVGKGIGRGIENKIASTDFSSFKWPWQSADPSDSIGRIHETFGGG